MRFDLRIKRTLAARFTTRTEGVYSCHPRQMITKKPLNVNDEDVFDGMNRTEQPLSQPTVMSYSLLRIRLGEISRNIVDRTPLIMAHLGGPSRDDIIDIDTDIQTLINDIPPFFNMSRQKLLETYDLTPTQAVNILFQGYTFSFLLHAQRCKLHLPYFIRGCVDTAYSSSREICVKSARLIVQSESNLADSGLRNTTRFKFCGLLAGLFMASIVLIMDLCVNKSSVQYAIQRTEAAEAFRILEEAKKESGTAAKFVDSLMHILRKHKVPAPKSTLPPRTQGDKRTERVSTIPDGTIRGNIPARQAHDTSLENPLEEASSNVVVVSNDSCVNLIDDLSDEMDLSTCFDELTHSFEQGTDFPDFDWNNIFTDLHSSFI
jgi:hypothetical protein